MLEPLEPKTAPVEESFPILVEWPNARGGVQKASREEALVRMQAEAERAINLAMGTIRSMAYRVSKTMNGLEDYVRPDEAEVEFGINLDAEAGALLAKTSAGAQLTVKLKWTIEQSKQAEIVLK